ncbi:scarecrow-like protein 9, partial [Trifolium medium]|nr:scarecrow-like protein 9 [Trifolium medium]
MLDSIVPREDWERMLIEKEIFGKEALNVIACEGCERVERPETYRQWQVRILRAGFLQQTFGKNTVERAVEKVKSSYHKDFVIDED